MIFSLHITRNVFIEICRIEQIINCEINEVNNGIKDKRNFIYIIFIYITLYFQIYLPKPTMCPEEVYRMMCSCWRRDETSRPTFKDIYTFLKNIISDYRPGA